VYYTQLSYEFQLYNPVILCDGNLNSLRLRAEQSEFITCFQHTDSTSQYTNFQSASSGNKKPTFQHALRPAGLARMEEYKLDFFFYN